jgi:oligopeptide/dipeptide ABC transporter ATP-binding protein
MMNQDLLLQVEDLRTYFPLREGTVKAVDGASFTIRRGQTVGVVGESGCGKSVTAFSILQIVGRPGRIVSGRVLFHRPLRGTGDTTEVVDLAALHPRGEEMRQVRGGEIAMIFQEPMSSLSMMHTVGFQIEEALHLHSQISRQDAHDKAIEMLGRVGIPRPEERVNAYPFELSGGMRQRAMIAMALCCNPSLLIADEPTTALDVTTQAQILDLMASLQEDLGMAIMLITHDLGVVAESCDEIVVMYLGEVAERAPVDALFYDPQHPYTRALLHSIPMLGRSRGTELEPIEGMVPDPYNRPTGCPFHPRCVSARPGLCDRLHPEMADLPDGRAVRCLLYAQTSEVTTP